MGIPMLLAIGLILYISYVYLYNFIPYEFPEHNFTKIIIEIVFYYLSFMTVACILLTAISDPGYLKLDYQHPLTSQGFAPLNQLRLLNMRMFISQKLYDFSRDNVNNGDYEDSPCITLDNSVELV